MSLSFGLNSSAQRIFNLPPLPESIANNAVVGDPRTGRIYSFSGIDSSLVFTGIHAKSFMYNPTDSRWERLEDLPSGTPRIAAAANILNDTIYVVGGYQVNANDSEVSLNDVHRLALNGMSFASDASPIPLPIDDHVQEVIGDTALIQFTGWSNTGNTTLVQYYVPTDQTWRESSRTRNQFLESFGAAGVQVGDTLYYIGGAADIAQFPIQPYLRKGAINPTDLSEIEWSFTDNNLAATYRPGSFKYDNKAYWIGGGDNTYNYDGIAYDGSGIVEPLNQLLEYDPKTGVLRKIDVDIPAVMDLRGIAQISESEFCVVGGMASNQKVLNTVWCIDMSTVVSLKEPDKKRNLILYPNPVNNTVTIKPSYTGSAQVSDEEGKIISRLNIIDSTIDISELKNGIYFLYLNNANRDVVKFIKGDI